MRRCDGSEDFLGCLARAAFRSAASATFVGEVGTFADFVPAAFDFTCAAAVVVAAMLLDDVERARGCWGG